MLSSLEMVSEPSGKTKTLADLIKEGSIITPETPVYTSDDSMELKEYIESLIPEPPAPGLKNWELLGTIENLNFNVPTKITGDLLELFSVNNYTEVLIQADYHGTDLQCPLDNIITLPENLLDLWYITVTASFTISLPNDTPQTTAPGYFKFYKDGDDYYVLYRGASFFQTNLLLTIKVYVR